MNRRIPKTATSALAVLLIALTACETTNSDEWTGGATTPFAQAERSCREQLEFVSEEENRREIFVGCMAALGWQPRAGASIDL